MTSSIDQKQKGRLVALIPARSGSKRIKDKNIKSLGNHPLIAYSIRAAINSGIFEDVICATDSEIYANIARGYGAQVPALRPEEISQSKSPDIEWVQWILELQASRNKDYEFFSIIRPTSPFRTSKTIKRAWIQFQNVPYAESIRAVEPCKEHPGKMWIVKDQIMLPLIPFDIAGTPWHSSQYANLPEIYVQNASLEISKTDNVLKRQSISGNIIVPFLTEGLEGVDLNDSEDWVLAEELVRQGLLPPIE